METSTEELKDQEVAEEAPQDLSPEEIEKMRTQMEEHYKEQIPFLKVQAEYEILLAQIEEARTRRITAQVHRAQMFGNTSEDSEEEQPKERKLRST